jgi:hypothetical protein
MSAGDTIPVPECGCCWWRVQVLLLLKSSDRIQHDLTLLQQLRASLRTQAATPAAAAAAGAAGAAAGATAGASDTVNARPQAPAAPSTTSTTHEGAHGQLPAVLVLREWFDLRPECELRCFVHQHRVVGVCQRDVSQHFPQLQGQQQQLAAAAVAAHQRCIGDTFAIPSCEWERRSCGLFATWSPAPCSQPATYGLWRSHTGGCCGGLLPRVLIKATVQSGTACTVLADMLSGML